MMGESSMPTNLTGIVSPVKRRVIKKSTFKGNRTQPLEGQLKQLGKEEGTKSEVSSLTTN
jgi:hypothetical protein